MPDRWYRALCYLLSAAYYRRIRVVNAAGPAARPTLYVGLHRNGAVDGLIYKRVFPRATFLIASQLTRSRFGRLFFTGIPVTRANDRGDRSMNAASLERCVAHLTSGGDLFVLPEGTSDLGPSHLPFKPGVARILERALSAGTAVTVVPVGIFYSAADAFRSDVTVVRGPDISTELPRDLDARGRAAELMARISAALETIGVNVSSADELARIERMAALVAETPGESYYAALKALEHAHVPGTVATAWTNVTHAIDRRRVATEHGVPVVSGRGAVWNVAWLAVQAAVVALASLLNVPVIAAGWLAGRRLADARNTIALWRLLVSAPVAAVWITSLLAFLAITRPSLALGYVAITFAGLAVYPELCARWPRVRNRRVAREITPDLETVRPWVRSLVTTHG